jgi:SAM-dependent methyltransferase
MTDEISPYGGKASRIDSLRAEKIKSLYYLKCGVDVSEFLSGIDSVELYECQLTGYKYWLPDRAAGNEKFYQVLSRAWKNYYQTARWEYPLAASYANNGMSCLEIGCGRGFFLKSIEGQSQRCVGLEFNTEAIENKVCSSPVLNETIEEHSRRGNLYDIAYSFQVLEHVTRPRQFIESTLKCLRSGGLFIVSTPNDDFGPHKRMEDAFNLPPHHVGCYNANIYENISAALGIELVSTVNQKCEFPIPRFSSKTTHSLGYRAFNKISSKLGDYFINVAGEPGHTILAIFRKP